jgi:hypothetical protein
MGREQEAECEHRRWNAYVLTTGFTRSTEPTLVKKVMLPPLKDPVKLKDLAKADPSLTEFAKLDDGIRNYDRQIVDARSSIFAAFDACEANH